ncbi:MAG TPA: MFS transporter [Hyphomicrobium sp.]|jgi:MFS family permease|nr:MFS transporter [Hyphomicrobium sp.]
MTVSEASPGTPANGAPPSDRAFDYPGYRLYWVARFLLVFAIQVLSVSVGWQIYDQTRDPFLLGLVGLVQFLPAPILVLVTGSVADRYNRRIIMASCMAVEAVCALALLTILHQGLTAVWPVYAVLLVFGIARAFMGPAVQSLMANLVPQAALANAIALNSSSFQVATIIGPTAGGLLYGVSSELAYVVSILFFLSAGVLTLLIPKPEKRASQPVTTEALFAGFRYIWSQPIVLGALSLDMIAVMLGGAIALLPVFARDILDVGPWGLGALRSSVGVGALLMSLWLINNPVRDHAGLTMFAAVAVYGLAIVVFGMSTLVWLSVLALAVMGAADMVSVFIRQTLIQLKTPDDLRGRVSAVNMTFIGASNELGEFRAGTMAAGFGAVPAVVIGGVGALLTAAVWARMFPDLRNVRHLDRMD